MKHCLPCNETIILWSSVSDLFTYYILCKVYIFWSARLSIASSEFIEIRLPSCPLSTVNWCYGEPWRLQDPIESHLTSWKSSNFEQSTKKATLCATFVGGLVDLDFDSYLVNKISTSFSASYADDFHWNTGVDVFPLYGSPSVDVSFSRIASARKEKNWI